MGSKVVGAIFSKALAEPHYCEMYAEMVHSFRWRFPEFPPETMGERPCSFARMLLDLCQKEYEASLGATSVDIHEWKQQMSALLKFLGNLHLFRLIAYKVIGQVVYDLIGPQDNGKLSEAHMVECACELLQVVGDKWETTQLGRVLMDQKLKRLEELKAEGSPQTGRAIQDFIDLRDRSRQASRSA